MVPKVAPFGTWNSPISAAYVAKAGVSFDDVLVDPIPSRVHPNGNAIYYIEKRPTEAGRNVLVDAATKKDVYGKGFNARSAVQEYGGAGTVVHGGVVYFSNFGDGRLYKIDRNAEGGDPVPVSLENKNHRFANFAVHPTSPHLLVSILEDHTKPTPGDVVTTLVTINTQTSSVHPLVSGADFYAAPTFNLDGTRLAWVQWDHPDMPWDGAQVHVADVIKVKDENLELRNVRKVKGVHKKESAVRPQWIDARTLLFFSDESGFHNPWIVDVSSSSPEPRPVLSSRIDQDFSDPDWLLGGASAAALTESSAFVVAISDGRSELYLLDLETGTLKDLPSPYVVIRNIRRTSPRSAVFLGIKSDEPTAVVEVLLDESGVAKFISLSGNGSDASSESDKIDKSFFSTPEPLTLRTREGFPLYAVFYAPTNPDFTGPEEEKPLCVVNVHGGPTGLADQGFNLRKQFFTSRGFAWVDVNYGGSSGYGRKYIERLDGEWGLTDVGDVVDAVEALASISHNRINRSRVMITGGSAGGYTVLQSLCSGRSSVYAAGTSSFGVSNLLTLVQDTHKFESKYMGKLLGGKSEDISYVLRSRSPVFHADKIKVPLLLLQGADDKVVPPSQSEEMLKVIRERGGRVEYELFEGEGHGWRKAETIVAALEKELGFYLKVIYEQ